MVIGDYMKFINMSKNNYEITNVRDGIIRTKTMTDELDSATVVLTQVDALDIEPYDLIQLVNTPTQFEYWLVADASYSVVNFKDSKFDYTINLVSLTKLLECVQLPSMSITNIGQNRTVGTYINNVLKYFNDQMYSDYGYNIGLALAFDVNIRNAVCPECTFSQPTLREYLDYILQFYGCIASVSFDGIKFRLNAKSLNTTSTAIPITYLDKIEGSISASDYVTILEHNIDGVIETENIVEQTTLKSNDYLMHSDNAQLITNNKIYDIVKVEVIGLEVTFNNTMIVFDDPHVTSGNKTKTEYSDLTIGGTNSNWNPNTNNKIDVDITKYVLQADVFQSKELLNINFGGTPQIETKINEEIARFKASVDNGKNVTTQTTTYPNDNTVPESIRGKTITTTKVTYNVSENDYPSVNQYQNNCIYFSRGNNVISNLLNYQTRQITNFTFYEKTAIEYAIRSAVAGKIWEIFNYGNGIGVTKGEYNGNAYFNDVNISTNANWKNIKVRVTYKGYANKRLSLEQRTTHKHRIAMPDNSTNAMTDIKKYIDASYEKNNQLGNQSLILQATIPNGSYYSNTFDVGMYYQMGTDKYILNKIESTAKAHSIVYKGILTKNYSNRNINNVLNREKRYFSLPLSSDSCLRKESKIIYVDSLPSETPDVMIYKWYCDEQKQNFQECAVYCSVTKTDNCVIYTGSFCDNIIAYQYVNKYDEIKIQTVGSNTIGGFKMVNVNYCNDYGENYNSYVGFGQLTALGKSGNFYSRNTSITYITPITLKYNFDILKDAREQLEFNLIFIKK